MYEHIYIYIYIYDTIHMPGVVHSAAWTTKTTDMRHKFVTARNSE